MPAALSIYASMLLLESAVGRFSRTTDKVERVGQALKTISDAFLVFNRTPLGALKEMATKSLEAIPDLEKIGPALRTAAAALEEGVNALEDPANRLATILDHLGESITAFGEGFNLTEDVARMAEMVERYAVLLEGASQRIEAAVRSRAVPAMRAAEEAGIEETVRSEAIATVKVMDGREGEENSDEQTELLRSQVEILQSLDDKLSAFQGDAGKGTLQEIIDLLQEFLPGLQNKGDSGLGSELNQWMK
jgi:hypothetical protein